MPEPKTFPRILVGFFIVLVALFLIGYVPRFLNWHQLEKEAAAIHPLLVNVIKATADNKPIELILPSTTQAIRVTPIWARTNGSYRIFMSI